MTTPNPKRRRPVVMTALDGGQSLSDEQANREWIAAWSAIAEACDRGLAGMHPLHPRRGEMVKLVATARQAAREPAVRGLR